MGILTIPQGTTIYRSGDLKKERAKKEFNILGLPTTKDGREAYSIKMRDEYWFVFKADIPGVHDE